MSECNIVFKGIPARYNDILHYAEVKSDVQYLNFYNWMKIVTFLITAYAVLLSTANKFNVKLFYIIITCVTVLLIMKLNLLHISSKYDVNCKVPENNLFFQ